MKTLKQTLIILVGILLVSCNSKSTKENIEHSKEHLHKKETTHRHTHYSEHLNVDGHKLIFPSRIPDRIITNLT